MSCNYILSTCLLSVLRSLAHYCHQEVRGVTAQLQTLILHLLRRGVRENIIIWQNILFFSFRTTGIFPADLGLEGEVVVVLAAAGVPEVVVEGGLGEHVDRAPGGQVQHLVLSPGHSTVQYSTVQYSSTVAYISLPRRIVKIRGSILLVS